MSKIGTLNVILHRPVEGKIKTVTLSRSATGKWYVCFSCEIEKPQPLPKTGNSIGIDVGLESFLTDSNGAKVENPRWYRATERKLKITQRIVSKRKKGGNRRRRAIRQLALAHEKVCNQRLDFHHKLAHTLIQNNDLIAFEDLRIKNMVRNGKLSKGIADAGWGQFLFLLAYKAECAGRSVIRVDPKQTSQLALAVAPLWRRRCPFAFIVAPVG